MVRTVRTAAALVAVAVLAGCSSTSAKPAASSSPASESAAAPSASSAALSAVDVCATLAKGDYLRAAEGFVVVAGVLHKGDVADTENTLRELAEEGPVEFNTALTNIADALQQLDEAAGTGATVDTSAVQPDANLLAGMCRSRGLAVPQV